MDHRSVPRPVRRFAHLAALNAMNFWMLLVLLCKPTARDVVIRIIIALGLVAVIYSVFS